MASNTVVKRRRHSPDRDRPNMSELRIVVLGNNVPETSRVGNFILGRDAFETEAPPPSVEQHSERARGQVEGRYITLIQTPHLFNTELTQEELNQRVKECVTLSAPGPHVFLLVHQSDKFTKEDQDKIRRVLDFYGPLAVKHSVVVTTDERYDIKWHLSTFIRECGESHHMSKFNKDQLIHILKKIYKVVEQNGGEHLIYKMTDVPVLEFKEGKQTGPSGRGSDQFTGTAMMDDGGPSGRGSDQPTGTAMMEDGGPSGRGSDQPTGTEMMEDGGPSGRGSDQTTRTAMMDDEVSELRIVVLGKNVPETSTVGNFILGKNVFETKAPPPSVEQRSERVGGQVEGRYITLIHTPHLFNTELTQEELNQRLKECVTLSAPGPHVIALVIQPNSFTKKDKNRVHYIFKSLSEDVHRYTLVITQNTECGTSVDRLSQNIIQEIIAQFSHRHFEFSSGSCCSALVEMMMEMFKENGGKHVILKEYKEILEQEHILQHEYGISSKQETSRAQEKNYKASTEDYENTTELEEYDLTEQQACKESLMKKGINYIMNPFRAPKPKLNLLLFGREPGVKALISNLLLGQKSLKSEKSLASLSVCIKKDGEACGHPLTLVEMPALYNTQLSEEEVMRETLHCVSLCDPGVHAFLFIIPVGPLSDKDKGEVDMVQRIFRSELQNYSMFFITGDSQGSKLSKSVSTVIKASGGRYKFCSSKTTSQELITCVEKLLKENGNLYYTSAMYHSAQAETQLQCKQKIIDLQRQITDLMKRQRNPPQESASTLPLLNLVLCGRDGALKASISDLILGQREKSPVCSSVCVRKEGEVCGHLLTLVEMPALYKSQLSEEEVMRETLRCVSLCDRGVHAFLFIIYDIQLTDEDKLEMEKIQKIFSPRVCNHSIVLFTQQSQKEQLSEDVIAMVKSYGRTHHFCSTKTNGLEVIQWVNNLFKENKGSQFTKGMYVDALIETQLTYKNDIEVLNKKISGLQNKHVKDKREDLDDLRIVLLGKTGVGKSATGNTILGKKNIFKELACSRSVTTVCQKETSEIYGKKITVIDTPGLFDTYTSNIEIQKEIAKCITLAAPGPHVFLLVLSVGSRFTQEEMEAVKMIQELFGHESRKHTMVLFTRGDDLESKPVQEYIDECEHVTKDIIRQCGNFYHVFNNKNHDDHSQVIVLLQKISVIVNMNGGTCYTNEMFQQTEKALKEEQERILKEREEEIEREKEELKAKHEAEMEKMRTKMEEEQKKQESERKRREEEFKQREEEIKKDMAEQEQTERENYNKRREEDDRRMKEFMEQINREREENRKEWERQRDEDQRRRDQEEEDRKRREQELKDKQKEEKEKFDQEKEEMMQKQRDHEKELQQEYDQKAGEEEKRRAELEEKIRHAEESKKKQLQELQQFQQQEWERQRKEEEKRREEQENMWRETLAFKQEQWTLEQTRKQQQYEVEKKNEQKKRTKKEKQRKQKEEEEKKRIEDETNNKIKQLQRDMDLQRESEAKEREEKYKKELEEKLTTQKETFQKEEEDRAKVRKEEEERTLASMTKMHEEEKNRLRVETEQAARKQAEEEFCTKLDEKVKEAKTEGLKEGYSKGQEEGHNRGFKDGSDAVEAQRTKLGKGIDAAVNNICSMLAGEKKKSTS